VEVGISDRLQLFNVMVTSKSVLKEILGVFSMLVKEENVNASFWCCKFVGIGFQLQYLIRSVMVYFLTQI